MSAIARHLKAKINSGDVVAVTRPAADGNAVAQRVEPFPAIIGKDGKVQPDLQAIPVRLGKHDAARLVTQFYWPTSHRTLERWSIKKVLAGGRCLFTTADLVNHCQITLAQAPAAGRTPKK